MNLREVIEESRILLSEVSHNINQGRSDSILSDRTILLAVNRCISEMEARLGLSSISYGNTEFNIPLIQGQSEYVFPEGVNSIHDLVVYNGNLKFFLNQVPFETIKYCVDIKGIPHSYSLDYKPGLIKLFPVVSSQNLILKFLGRVRSEKITQKDLDTELPFDARYHHAFIMYICYYTCRFLIDIDNAQKTRSADYYSEFNKILLEYQNDIIQSKLGPNGLRFYNDEYNT